MLNVLQYLNPLNYFSKKPKNIGLSNEGLSYLMKDMDENKDLYASATSQSVERMENRSSEEKNAMKSFLEGNL